MFNPSSKTATRYVISEGSIRTYLVSDLTTYVWKAIGNIVLQRWDVAVSC